MLAWNCVLDPKVWSYNYPNPELGHFFFFFLLPRRRTSPKIVTATKKEATSRIIRVCATRSYGSNPGSILSQKDHATRSYNFQSPITWEDSLRPIDKRIDNPIMNKEIGQEPLLMEFIWNGIDIFLKHTNQRMKRKVRQTNGKDNVSWALTYPIKTLDTNNTHPLRGWLRFISFYLLLLR